VPLVFAPRPPPIEPASMSVYAPGKKPDSGTKKGRKKWSQLFSSINSSDHFVPLKSDPKVRT
jgi:hypothetical protein